MCLLILSYIGILKSALSGRDDESKGQTRRLQSLNTFVSR